MKLNSTLSVRRRLLYYVRPNDVTGCNRLRICFCPPLLLPQRCSHCLSVASSHSWFGLRFPGPVYHLHHPLTLSFVTPPSGWKTGLAASFLDWRPEGSSLRGGISPRETRPSLASARLSQGLPGGVPFQVGGGLVRGGERCTKNVLYWNAFSCVLIPFFMYADFSFMYAVSWDI